jgi:DNA-binding MarR family transcriptional regulator
MSERQPSSRHSSPTTSTGWALWRASLAWQRRLRAILEPLGLTHGQFVVLAVTWWLTAHRGGPPTQRQVADHAGTDAMTTSQIVRRLHHAGHLHRQHDPEDGRARRLSLSPQGRDLLAAALPAVESVDAAFFAPLGEHEEHWRDLLVALFAAPEL